MALELIPLLLLAVSFSFSAKLPTNWPVCKNADERNECLAKAVQIAIKELADGNPSLGVFPMDPMKFHHIVIGEGLSGPVSIKLEFFDSDLIGLKNMKLSNFKTDWEMMTFNYSTPHLENVGGYKIKGRVLILPVVGTGNCKLSFDELFGHMDIKLGKVTKNGKVHFVVKSFVMDLNAKKLKMRFENLFNGDKALGDNFNLFINENWMEIFNELKPSISKAYGAAFKEVANRIFSKIPASTIA